MTNPHTIKTGERMSDVAETALPIAYNNNWNMQACINDASVSDNYALYGYQFFTLTAVKTRCVMVSIMDHTVETIRGHMITVGS